MALPTNEVHISAPPDRVFEMLTDPTTYPEWLLGAQHIRAVDDDWPAVGAAFHHRIGLGPLTTPGSTTVRAIDPPRSLVLGAGMGPLGEASVRFVLTPAPDGAGRNAGATVVRVEEVPTRGLARAAWSLTRPVVSVLLRGRNNISLVNLRRLVEDRCDTEAAAGA